MDMLKENRTLLLAFLTATAASVYIAENLVMRALPLPFIRLGLANVVVLYLLMEKGFVAAMVLNVTKSLIGAAFTFTLLSPSTLLSLSGGVASVLVMQLFIGIKPGFGIIGISVIGAVVHNCVQLFVVRYLILQSETVFKLLPLLLGLGLVSGIIVAFLANAFSRTMIDNGIRWIKI